MPSSSDNSYYSGADNDVADAARAVARCAESYISKHYGRKARKRSRAGKEGHADSDEMQLMQQADGLCACCRAALGRLDLIGLSTDAKKLVEDLVHLPPATKKTCTDADSKAQQLGRVLSRILTACGQSDVSSQTHSSVSSAALSFLVSGTDDASGACLDSLPELRFPVAASNTSAGKLYAVGHRMIDASRRKQQKNNFDSSLPSVSVPPDQPSLPPISPPGSSSTPAQAAPLVSASLPPLDDEPAFVDPRDVMMQQRENIAAGYGASLVGILGNARPDFRSSGPSRVIFQPGTFDPTWKPARAPVVTPRLIPTVMHKLFRAISVWHVFHVIAAAAFLYFSVNWVVTTFPKGVAPAGCALGNDTLVELSDIVDPDLKRACVDYQTYLALVRANWSRGVVLYAVFNGGLALVSAVACFLFWKRMQALEPKDTQKVLNSLFCGFPKGSIFFSYAWKEEPSFTDPRTGFSRPVGELPRAIARFFPGAGWIDYANLVPGAEVKPSCEEASDRALFRFAFIGNRYALSETCQIEWSRMEHRPGECFVFAYDNAPKDKLEEWRAAGHLIINVEDMRSELSESEWFLNMFVRSRVANPLFSVQSPGINEHWKPTLRFWMGQPDRQYLHTLPFIVGPVFVVGIDFLVAYHYKFNLLFSGFAGTALLFAVALTLPVAVLAAGLYFLNYLRGTGYPVDLPDAAYLLIFLKLLGVTETITLWSNSVLVTTDPDFRKLCDAGVVKLVDSRGDAGIKAVLIDEVEDGDFSGDEFDDTFIFWSIRGYSGMPDKTKQLFQSHIIADGLPSTEFFCCKILMRAFNCGAADLTVGTGRFRPSFPHREAESVVARLCRRPTCCSRLQWCIRPAAAVSPTA